MARNPSTTGTELELEESLEILSKQKPMSIDKKATIQLNLSWIMAAFIALQSFGMLNISSYIEALKLIPKISERLDKQSMRLDAQDEEIKRIREILVRAKLARLDLGKKEITTASYE